jgi:hypothetical protein
MVKSVEETFDIIDESESLTELIEELRKILNDDELIDRAILMSQKSKVMPSSVYGKNNFIYNLPHTELHTGLDLIGRSLKKPNDNSRIFNLRSSDSPIIKKLNGKLERDRENSFIICAIILQKEKEKNIKFIPTYINI